MMELMLYLTYFVSESLTDTDMLVKVHYFVEEMIEKNNMFDLMMVLVDFVENMKLFVVVAVVVVVVAVVAVAVVVENMELFVVVAVVAVAVAVVGNMELFVVVFVAVFEEHCKVFY
jgi:hypothetical protein